MRLRSVSSAPGNQAYWHARALCVVRRIGQVKVWSRNEQRAAATAERLLSAGVSARTAPLGEAANCDVVVTATPARSPVLDDQRLAPGACIVAMGADTPGKRELGPAVLERAAWIVADSLPQAKRAGELQWHSAPREGQTIVDLGSVLSGASLPERGDRPVVFDSTGLAFQDVVAASLLLKEMGKAIPADSA
jgi:ornithine cyclodeaminase/alanine dehydrogenase-like protein (mu-crystallin family)